MTITFSLASDTAQPNPIAIVDLGKLAAFRAFLRSESDRRQQQFLDPDDELAEVLPDSFEARVCPFALATIARLFGYDEHVITVVEEAQFRGQRVSFWHDRAGGDIRMRVSPTSDLGLELNLANGNAYALLEALEIEPESAGSLPPAVVLDRLARPTIRRRLGERGIHGYAGRLVRLLSSQFGLQENRMKWA